MKRILVISWFYPPINSSEGVVTYKLLKNSRFQFDVCMQESNALWSYGNNEKLPELDNVRRIPIQGDSLEIWETKTIEYFLEHKDEYEVVMTRSMPPESHKVGLKIKEIQPKIKWIASFGDPIANNPFVMESMKEKSPYSIRKKNGDLIGIKRILSPKRIIKNILWNRRKRQEYIPFYEEQKLEDNILKSCNYVILNNPYQESYMLGKYGSDMKEKALVLPHSFDEELYDGTVEMKDDSKIRMVYIGHLDDIRTPHLIFKAVLKLKKEHPDLSNRLELLFYGNMSAKEKLYLLDHELLDVVYIKKPVDYKTSLVIMKESDWLIHIDANLSGILNENIFFAAKLADYIGSGTPILGLTMFDGAGADIVRDVNGVTVSYTVDEIKNYLYLICYEGYTIEMKKDSSDKYNAKTVAATFDEFVESKVLS